MNRIDNIFQEKKSGLLSLYFCAGHPTLESTGDIIKTIEKNGIDFIEVGIPFSDPMADGPVIQNAATKALHNGMTLRKLFSQITALRKEGVKLPLILMGYMNPIYQMGFETFFRTCKEADVDGVIIPDLPFRDYIEEVKPIADKYDIRVIMLITPETSEERIRFIDQNTDGFIYMVSSAATTGAQKEFDEAIDLFDWDRSRAWYMDIAGSNQDFIYAISKKNGKVFKHFIKRGDSTYTRGREKYEELAFHYWCLNL